jgi:hypothetical protein
MAVDRDRLQWAESAEEKRDRIDVDGVKRLPETYGAEHEHRRAAEEGDPGAIEAPTGTLPAATPT